MAITKGVGDAGASELEGDAFFSDGGVVDSGDGRRIYAAAVPASVEG